MFKVVLQSQDGKAPKTLQEWMQMWTNFRIREVQHLQKMQIVEGSLGSISGNVCGSEIQNSQGGTFRKGNVVELKLAVKAQVEVLQSAQTTELFATAVQAFYMTVAQIKMFKL